jgi:uncharacterized metal-binding protein YceD (DUF177 family)
MNLLSQYVIPIQGLSDGNYNYQFIIEKEFFDEFGPEGYKGNRVVSDILMNKENNVYTIHFHLKGTVEVICDRCLENFLYTIDSEYTLFFKTGISENKKNENDEIIYLDENIHLINLSQYLYEFIDFSIPLRRVHPSEKDCNHEMIKILKKHTNHSKNDYDPRWDNLKELL